MFAAYTNALDLVRSLAPIVEALRSHNADLADQLVRAGTSVVLNVAEGSKRSGGDIRKFYSYAHGSASEIRACLDTADAWGWIVDAQRARALVDRELGLLWGLTKGKQGGRASRPVSG